MIAHAHDPLSSALVHLGVGPEEGRVLRGIEERQRLLDDAVDLDDVFTDKLDDERDHPVAGGPHDPTKRALANVAIFVARKDAAQNLALHRRQGVYAIEQSPVRLNTVRDHDALAAHRYRERLGTLDDRGDLGHGQYVRPESGRERLRDAAPAVRVVVHGSSYRRIVSRSSRCREGGLHFAHSCLLADRAERDGFRVVHFSVQGNHIHLVVEAVDKRALTRGMQGLAIRVARAINRAAGRKGSVFSDHYFVRELRTPAEVRRAVRYVLDNFILHTQLRTPQTDSRAASLSAPRTWLLTAGWLRSRAGPLPVAYWSVPAAEPPSD